MSLCLKNLKNWTSHISIQAELIEKKSYLQHRCEIKMTELMGTKGELYILMMCGPGVLLPYISIAGQ